jgi:hypothetical protein
VAVILGEHPKAAIHGHLKTGHRDLGLIKVKQIGNQRYKYVLLVHPTVAIQKLYEAGKIRKDWWEAFRARQIQTREERFEEREQRKADAQGGDAEIGVIGTCPHLDPATTSLAPQATHWHPLFKEVRRTFFGYGAIVDS